MPQQAFFRERLVPHLDDVLRPHPVMLLRRWKIAGPRRCPDLDHLEFRANFSERFVVKAGSDPAGVDQFLAVVDGEVKSANPGP